MAGRAELIADMVFAKAILINECVNETVGLLWTGGQPELVGDCGSAVTFDVEPRHFDTSSRPRQPRLSSRAGQHLSPCRSVVT